MFSFDTGLRFFVQAEFTSRERCTTYNCEMISAAQKDTGYPSNRWVCLGFVNGLTRPGYVFKMCREIGILPF